MAVNIELSEGIATIWLARPEKRNAFNAKMSAQILSALQTLATDINLRLLVIRGRGEVFCAGVDLEDMRALGSATRESNIADATVLSNIFYAVASFPTPVLSVIQGAAFGGGLGLAVCSDEVIALKETVFSASEVRLGIVPGVISPYLLRKCGATIAPMMLSGERLGALEARRLHIVNTLIDSLDGVSQRLETYLMAGPSAARKTKELIINALPLPSDELRENALVAIADARSSEEGRAGLDAFLKKGKAPWL